MNKKERITAAIACKPTDRTCYNFRAEKETLEKMYRSLGFRDYDKLLDMLDVDILFVNADFQPDKDMGGFYQNMWGERYVFRQTEYGPVREDMAGALAGAETLSEVEAFPWPVNDDIDYSNLGAKIDRHPDMVVQYGHADVWQRPGLVRGMENFMLDLVCNPDICHFLSAMFTDFYIEEYRRAQEAAGGRITIFNLYSDIGSQRAPLISRETLHEFVLPYIRRFAEFVHGSLNGKLFFHTCGMIYPYIGDLIDAGVDILDPMQPCAPQMQPENLAKEFGGKICFHGGIDVQGLMVHGSPQDVRDTVKRYADCFKGGGYICSASHFLQADAPVENILALYEEISKI